MKGLTLTMKEQTIAKEIDSNHAKTSEDAVKLSVGTSWLNLNVPVMSLAEKVRNRFGVRAMLSNLVFSKQGDGSLKKLLAMFEGENSRLSMKTHQYLIKRYSYLR